ncbi:MAG: serine O-acetyltransferase EpsC [bacterium]
MKNLTDWINRDLPGVVEKLSEKQLSGCAMCSKDGKVDMSTQGAVYEVLDELLQALFPGCYGRESVDYREVSFFVTNRLRRASAVLGKLLDDAYRYRCEIEPCGECDCEQMATETVVHLMQKLPELHGLLMSDIQAAYDGDPAAKSFNEIILSYPCVEAISTYRIAHELYHRRVPIIPRIMTDRAHSRTGVDIHPGAEIGKSFFIDHGTGVVIGETCVIGDNVRIYQGVTLGAMSIPLDESGKPVRGEKRHPNIEDGVIIYAGATILGGDTTVGRGSIIGGSVWLTESVPPYSLVQNAPPKLRVVSHNGENSSKGEKSDGKDCGKRDGTHRKDPACVPEQAGAGTGCAGCGEAGVLQPGKLCKGPDSSQHD